MSLARDVRLLFDGERSFRCLNCGESMTSLGATEGITCLTLRIELRSRGHNNLQTALHPGVSLNVSTIGVLPS
jgi:tRNA(Ile2) C34 agmatinyltransferase TiaS